MSTNGDVERTGPGLGAARVAAVRFARIVMLDFAESDLEPEDWSALGALTLELQRCRSVDPELRARLRDADCLLVQLGVAVTAEMLDAAPRLRYVGVFGTSTGRIDAGASARGIAVRNVPGFSTEAVAELAIAIALDHLRDLTRARQQAARGDFSEPTRLGRELRGRRVGVLGLGAIGRRVAEIAGRGFGAEVRYWSRTPRPDAGIPRLEIDPLISGSEIVFVHLALTPQTRGLLDAERIARLEGAALVVLLAPPELVDMSALVARLEDRTLYFATDHGDEMDPRDLEALRGIDACGLYPPVGYGTGEARAARRAGFLAEIGRFLSGA